MKFYQSRIFKILIGLIAIIIIFKFSFLILLTGIGLVAYLNIKNSKFKSFNKAGKILLSSFIILFALLSIGIKNSPTADKTVATDSKVETKSESVKPAESSEVKEDTKSTAIEEVKPTVSEDNKSQQSTSNDTKIQTANNSSTANNNTSVKSSESTNINPSTNNASTANASDENTIVYCVPKSDVYHLSKNDPTLSKSKNIYEITLKEAKARGMHQSKSKADN